MTFRHCLVFCLLIALCMPLSSGVIAQPSSCNPPDRNAFATDSPFINLVLNVALIIVNAQSDCTPSDGADTSVADATCVMRVTVEQQNLPLHVYPETPTNDSITV